MNKFDAKTEALITFIYRSMCGGQKIAIAMKMRENAIEDMRTSIRQQWPDISGDDLEFEVRKQCLGVALAERTEPMRREYIRRQRERQESNDGVS